MIEINLGGLQKNEKTIYVKATSKRKAHYRTIHVTETESITDMGLSAKDVVSMESGTDVGISGTLHQDNLFICKLKDKSSGIYKILNDNQIFGEVTYYKMNKILDSEICPETVEINLKGDGSLQRWIPDGDGPYMYGEGGIKIEEKHFDNLSKIFVQDLICGNSDRGRRNIIITDTGGVHAIDNESWGSDYTEKELNSLYTKSGLGYKSGYSPMLGWMSDSMTEDEFITFTEYVKESIINVLNKKDEIIELYKNSDKHEIINKNFDIVENYIKE